MKLATSCARKELLGAICLKYSKSRLKEKTKILDGFVAATGLQRKYAISLLNAKIPINTLPKRRGRKPKYETEVQQVLKTLWYAANKICSKRLAPFIPELVEILEQHGHLSLAPHVRSKILEISAATIDRFLSKERVLQGKGVSTTGPGTLLKKQIQVRTFADWNEKVPGFMEIDLVAHCGGNLEGTYLNTLTMVDIVTGWVELGVLLYKNGAQVLTVIDAVRQVLPFQLLGIDSDNGSEFINYDLLGYCEKEKITFTRSRAYRKNDQAHVEEKNGSVVRRVVGYNRYEGEQSYQALIKLYSLLRLYINYFQPSLKLLSKTRVGSKVIKKYDKAKTPYQRLLNAPGLSKETQTKLREAYKKLDPIELLNRIEVQQKTFFNLACVATATHKDKAITLKANLLKLSEEITSNPLLNAEPRDGISVNIPIRCCSNTKKPRKKLDPRTWKTRDDAFAMIWDKISIRLATNATLTAKAILNDLINAQPQSYKISQLRTLQRRVKSWREEHLERERRQRVAEIPSNDMGKDYLSVTITAG